MLSPAADFYKQVDYSQHGLRDRRVFDGEKVAAEHKARPSVDYYPFTMKQLLKAGNQEYIDKTPAMNGFLKFLEQNYELSHEEIEETDSQLIRIINNETKVSAVLEYLQDSLEIPSFEFLQILTEEITELFNNTRQWILKGHTPHELFQEEKKHLKPLPSAPLLLEQVDSKVIDIKTRTKIGRNDPCPCGSGKKFMKCCGG